MKRKILTISAIVAMASFSYAAEKEKKPDPLKDLDPVARMKIMKQFDKDGDGVLSKEEKAEARKALENKTAELVDMKKKHAEEVLAKYDTNRDGALDANELAIYLEAQRKLFESMNSKDEKRSAWQKDMLAKYDKNGDGVIDDAEREQMRADFEKRRAEMLKKYDKDGDGKLSDAEREQMHKDNPDMPRYRGGSRGGGGQDGPRQ